MNVMELFEQLAG